MTGAAGSGKRVTLRDVAAHARVSVATASYVISGAEKAAARYTDETADRVRRSAAELHYMPNRMARSVRTGRTGIIQLVLHMLSDPWSQSIAESFNEATSGLGWTTLIAMDSDFAAALSRSEFDAAFVAATGIADAAQWRDALGPVARKVAVYSHDLEPDGFDVIRFDQRRASQVAMDHLLEHRRRVGCLIVEGAADRPEDGVRRDVYVDAMRGAGLDIPDGYIVEHHKDLVDPYRAARLLLDRDDRPDAVFAGADFSAFAAVHTARELGLRVPEDVAVVGIGDSRQAALAGISSVGAVDMGARIVDFVLQRARDAATPTNRILELEPVLFARASTSA